jgi:hypothetical protein
MFDQEPLTGDPARWPHLEACYQLARTAALGFAPGACAEGAFTAARWGLVMGLVIGHLDPALATAAMAELEDHDLTRDGPDAATHARWSMMQDVAALARAAREYGGE